MRCTKAYRLEFTERAQKIVDSLTLEEKVSLLPGEVKDVTISCPVDKLFYFNEKTNQIELEHMDYEVYIGTSSCNDDLIMGTINI